MELNEFLERIAQNHVDRSMSEMVDDAKVAQWETGERAKQQAEEIVTQLLTEAQQVLEHRSKDHDDQQ